MTRRSIEGDVAELLVELAESRSVAAPPWQTISAHCEPVPSPRRSRLGLVVSVAAVALVIMAALVVVARRPNTVTTGPATTEPQLIEGPALLVPGLDGPAVSASKPRPQPAVEEPRGAVEGPGGTIYTLSLASATDEAIPGELVDLAGRETTILTDGSAPTQIYRTIDLGCVLLDVTTGDAPALSAELTVLVESLTVSGVDVTVDLPPDWTSYGVTRLVEQYASTAQVQTDSTSSTDISLQQSPGAPIGYYLFGETAPVLLASAGTDQLWHVAGATTPGYHTLVGTRFGTAFRLSGEVPVDLLRSVVDTFTAADAPDALPPSSNAGSSEVATGTGVPGRQGCSSPPTLAVNS